MDAPARVGLISLNQRGAIASGPQRVPDDALPVERPETVFEEVLLDLSQVVRVNGLQWREVGAFELGLALGYVVGHRLAGWGGMRACWVKSTGTALWGMCSVHSLGAGRHGMHHVRKRLRGAAGGF